MNTLNRTLPMFLSYVINLHLVGMHNSAMQCFTRTLYIPEYIGMKKYRTLYVHHIAVESFFSC